MGPWALGPYGCPAVKKIRSREQPLKSFRARVRVRGFSVGPWALRSGPVIKNMRFREQPPMSFWVRTRVRWFRLGPWALGP